MKIRKKSKNKKIIQKMVRTQYDIMRERRNRGFEKCQHSRMKGYKKVLKRWPWINDETWLKGRYRDRYIDGVRVYGRPHKLRTLD